MVTPNGKGIFPSQRVGDEWEQEGTTVFLDWMVHKSRSSCSVPATNWQVTSRGGPAYGYRLATGPPAASSCSYQSPTCWQAKIHFTLLVAICLYFNVLPFLPLPPLSLYFCTSPTVLIRMAALNLGFLKDFFMRTVWITLFFNSCPLHVLVLFIK